MLDILLLLIIDVYIIINTGKKTETQINTPAPEGGVSKKEWTVYGTSWCGWTKKQLVYLEILCSSIENIFSLGSNISNFSACGCQKRDHGPHHAPTSIILRNFLSATCFNSKS